jgi:hypothetical protein
VFGLRTRRFNGGRGAGKDLTRPSFGFVVALGSSGTRGAAENDSTEQRAALGEVAIRRAQSNWRYRRNKNDKEIKFMRLLPLLSKQLESRILGRYRVAQLILVAHIHFSDV